MGHDVSVPLKEGYPHLPKKSIIRSPGSGRLRHVWEAGKTSKREGTESPKQ
jgi:hypothetical protein